MRVPCPSLLSLIQRPLTRFARDERGDLLTLGLFWAVIMLLVGGFTIDYLNATAMRTQLQNTADSSAQAALLTRQHKSAADAESAAVAVAKANMPTSVFGNVVTTSDVTFGTWDNTSGTFSTDASSTSAVRVITQMTRENGNPVATYMLGLVGLNYWNIRRAAVYTTYRKSCFMQGFVAQGTIDLQSNNTYFNDFCLHSNDHIELNSNNTFYAGTIVSMPDLSDLVLPKSGSETNDGLKDALTEDRYNIRILDELPGIISNLNAVASEDTPSYITSTTVVDLKNSKVAQGDVTSGSVNRYTCSGNQTLSFDAGTTVSNAVIVTNCKVKFGQGVKLENVVVATTNTNVKSVTAPSGLQVGKNDNCATGGGAQLLTMGGMDFASDLQMYGGQLIANGDIDFSANANGIQGAAMVAGGQINGTSNMDMANCPGGMEQNFVANYFRLAL